MNRGPESEDDEEEEGLEQEDDEPAKQSDIEELREDIREQMESLARGIATNNNAIGCFLLVISVLLIYLVCLHKC